MQSLGNPSLGRSSLAAPTIASRSMKRPASTSSSIAKLAAASAFDATPRARAAVTARLLANDCPSASWVGSGSPPLERPHADLISRRNDGTDMIDPSETEPLAAAGDPPPGETNSTPGMQRVELTLA